MTDTLTPPTDADDEPKKPTSWVISIDVPVGDEVAHVVARMEPDTVGEARARERLAGVALVDQLVPISETSKAVVIAARLLAEHADLLRPLIPDGASADMVAMALVDGLPFPALMASMSVTYE